ncbi:metallophosphoesterase family protein [Paludisphaera mucosa]|uniref:Metallophosphoesterase n=1 Tax=Paludisphaera mucosa TaxID=3030827 RepID=A0ABT6FD13_9BACT|nr:metallophosphoesterase [Paludisphaera mucosa]MDG3005278.1 metallophosphoesterase [Paludisphaera mucosa]
MPIHLPPTSRRTFLNSLALGGAALVLPGIRPTSAAGRDEPGGYVALLADTHIDQDAGKVVRDAFNVSASLRAVVADVLAQPRPPACVAVVGDLALKNGQPGDYGRFLELVAPLRERGIPVHLTLGNHDDRDAFRKALHQEAEAAVEGRCAAVVEAAGARLVLLDSLDKVDEVPGLLGEAQRAWLARTLDAAPAAATVVLVHHNPSPTAEPAPGTLQDTAALLDILRPRKQVKALVYGHTHAWRRSEEDGLHLVNLPAVAYPFEKTEPVGWCRFEPLRDGRGATFELRCTGGDRSKDGERAELAWRGA